MWSPYFLFALLSVGVDAFHAIALTTTKDDEIQGEIVEIEPTSGPSSHLQNEIMQVDVPVGGQLAVIHEEDSVVSQGEHSMKYNLEEFMSDANDDSLDKHFEDLKMYLRKIKRKGRKYS